MTHEILAFVSYYLCAFCIHGVIHLHHPHPLPNWARRSRAHKVAAVTAMVGTAAGYEGVQGYMIHLLIYGGLFL